MRAMIRVTRNIARSARAVNLGTRADHFEGPQLILYLFSIGRRLGRPFGFPDVRLTNRVHIPPSCSLSYRPAADFDSDGISIWVSSNESVMGAPKVGSRWSFELSTFPPSISHLIRAHNYVRRAQDLKVAGPHMPKAFSACADHS